MTRIAYQGIPGAYSQLAAHEILPGARTVPMPDFTAVVRAVLRGSADFGILPVENTAIGAVIEAQSAVDREPGVEIIEELSFAVRHCLLALPGATLDAIRHVESHPAALAQCTRWLSARRLPPRPVADTAGAARSVAADRDFTRAAIASASAAETYGLAVLARDIGDAADNRTRFVLVRALRAEVAA